MTHSILKEFGFVFQLSGRTLHIKG